MKRQNILAFAAALAGVSALIFFAAHISLPLAANPFANLAQAGASGSAPAFYGAQGSGAVSVGGRGGKVIEVTNLNDSGPGSLRACVQASGARTCVFRVGGTISLQSQLEISNPYITIAGQTAPGGGILIKGMGACTDVVRPATHDIIIRYIRIRVGKSSCFPDQTGDAVSMYGGISNVIIDHTSASWALDETYQFWSNGGAMTNLTLSNNLLAESLAGHSTSIISGAQDGATAATIGPIDMHHNLLMNTSHRQPLLMTKPVRWVNNIVYNWGFYATQTIGGVALDAINNIYKAGPISPSVHEIQVFPGSNGDSVAGNPSIYVSGNIGPHNSNSSADNWGMVEQISGENGSEIGSLPASYRRTSPLPALPIPIIPTPTASLESQLLSDVGDSARLDCLGNFVPNRDSVDNRLIQDYQQGKGSIPNSENDVGGFPNIASGTACADSDHDGMPDQWEAKYGLNSNSAADGTQDKDGDGFTNLEEYLNGTSPLQADAHGGVVPPVTPPSGSTPPAAPAERGRVRIQNGTVVADDGYPLRFGSAHVNTGSPVTDINFWKTMRDKGHFNGIRVMGFLGGWPKSTQTMTVSELLPILDQAVANAKATGMYIIIDNHSECCTGYNLANDTAFWNAVAPRYANDTNVIYEVKNEPTTPTGNGLNDYETQMYRLIRAAAPQTHIVLWSPTQLVGLPASPLQYFSPGIFNDPNASFGFHNYQTGSKIDELKSDILALKQRYPVFSTEIDVNMDAAQPQARDLIAWFEQQGISWVLLNNDYTGLPNGTVVPGNTSANNISITWPLDPSATGNGSPVPPSGPTMPTSPVPISFPDPGTPPPAGAPTPVTVPLFPPPPPLSPTPPPATSPSGIDLSSPIVVLQSPADGLQANGAVSLSAAAIDDTGVKSVTFYANDQVIATISGAPYTYNWDTTNLPAGAYFVAAVATDFSGNVSISDISVITVGDISTAPQPAPAPAPQPAPAPAPQPTGPTPPPVFPNPNPAPAPAPTPPSSEQRVEVSFDGELNVRSAAGLSGSILGTHAGGAQGTVVAGPTSADGYSWIKVDYDSGADGWSLASSLTFI